MELKKYIYPLRRWWWLLASATLVSAFFSLLVTLRQPPVYQARTTLMMGRTIEDPNPSTSEFWLSQQLAGTYADIANREVVQEATMAALNLKWLPSYKARALPNSQLIEIAVTDTDPQRAMVVANELANQLIQQTPTSVRPDEIARQEFVNQQLDTLETQIKQTQSDISQLQGELGNMVSARQINDTQNQIAALQAKLATLQGNYATLLSNTQRGAVNTLSVIEPAALPGAPIGPAKATSVLVAAIIGLALAAGGAYLLEYLDDTLKTPEDFNREVGYPIIGYIAEMDSENMQELYVANHPRYPASEAIRGIRTNLEFASVDNPLKTILVTSADTSEGKSSIAANLAAAIAQGDKDVIVIDADMRKPRIHEFFNLPNDFGLSDFFRGRSDLESVIRVWKKDERVKVITGGSAPPNPVELLGSKKMDLVLESMKQLADYVIVDGPPFVVTDAAVLASKVDGIVVVARPAFTIKATAKAMVEQIERAGARVLGVVLNRIPRKLGNYYIGQLRFSPYYPYSPYFDSEEKPATQGKLRQAFSSIKETSRLASARTMRSKSDQGADGIPKEEKKLRRAQD